MSLQDKIKEVHLALKLFGFDVKFEINIGLNFHFSDIYRKAMSQTNSVLLTEIESDQRSHIMRKPVYAICKQRCRSACISVQSDLCLRCMLPRQYNTHTLQSLYYATRYKIVLVITWPGLGSQMVIFLQFLYKIIPL